MPTPIQRSPIRPARGSRAEMERALAAGELHDGELVWFRDEQILNVVECNDPAAGSSGMVLTPIEGCCSTYTFAPTPHDEPVHGDRWTSSMDGRHYTYTDDGDSGQWVELAV